MFDHDRPDADCIDPDAPMTTCPHCRLPMGQIGRLIAATDVAGQDFTFSICTRCTTRLDRLPLRLQCRQIDLAISNLERYPERYEIRFFESTDVARLFISLEAERLRG